MQRVMIVMVMAMVMDGDGDGCFVEVGGCDVRQSKGRYEAVTVIVIVNSC